MNDLSKNIVVCADGTGNEGGVEGESNVFRIYRLLEDDSEEQVAYYDQGLGTEKWSILGKAFGVGISTNIRDCYEFIVDTYETGDRLFLLGFSRGAFTVRSLGGMIARCGLVKRKYRSLTMQAFKLYKKKNAKEALAFRKKFSVTKNAKPRTDIVHFIGVWDTVGALGLPFKTLDYLNPYRHRFHDTRLNVHVPFAYQALAIDDKRRVFEPTLWSQDNVPQGQIIEQLWFAGMHADVGGGYLEDELSDVTLEWMLQRAESHDVKFVANWKDKIHADASGKMHNSRDGLGVLYRRKVRDVAKLCRRYHVKLQAHISVRQRMDDPECNYAPRNIPHCAVPDAPQPAT